MVSGLSERFNLNDCVGCRSCSESCPSYRNGGIDPEATVSKVIDGSEIEDIWKCLQCHRCTMMCPQNIDVAGMMLYLKEISTKNGSVPQKIIKSAELFAKDCKLSVPKGRMEVLRNDLDLNDVAVTDGTISEMNEMLRSTGFSND